MGWTPIELLAMVLGFMVYWPIGVAIIGWKLMQRKGLPLDGVAAGLREMFATVSPAASGAPAGWGGTASGNAAFDEWRKAEIERLEAERRKLDEARRAFTDFAEQARKARDQEEFERFFASRPS